MLRASALISALLTLLAEPAFATSHTPSISGNGWIAMALLIGFIAMIVMVVFGSLHLEERDARLGRRRGDGGFLMPFHGDDDDDFHHPGHGHH